MNPTLARLPRTLAVLLLALGFAWTGAQAQGPAPGSTEPSLLYTVKRTDKLIRLTRDMLIKASDWPEVARFNRLRDPNIIRPGQQLAIPLRLLKSQPGSGRVIVAEGDVELNGSAATVGAAVAEGSRLRTGANSSAVLELTDGSRVKILPGSLAEIATQRHYAMRDASTSGSTTWFSGLIRLAQGALETLAMRDVKRATPLQIETPTSLVGVRGTQFRVAYEDPATRNSRAEVVDGLVRADNPAQQSGVDLTRGTGAVINPAQREVQAITLLSAPILNATPAEVVRPLGAWPMPTLAGAQAFRVQIASDESFDRIVRDIKVEGGSVDLGGLALGNWYARVRGIDRQGLEGFDSVKLIVVKEAPPPPPPPPPAMQPWRIISSSVSVQNGQSLLRWSAQQADGQPLPAAATSARLGRDAALSDIVSEPRSTGASQMVLGDLRPGVYYLRLRTQDSAGKPIDSELYRLEIPGNWGATVFDMASGLQPTR
ncbi:MAG: FecR domain-containing protein [Burkholderiaceae bacterium]|nr:FecR domain-containing protein [Burkholderiaceae bacterium]MDO9090332.1 FecR domain-containing protein [Burkholderiaceae bacterium]